MSKKPANYSNRLCNRPHYTGVTCVCGGTAIDPRAAIEAAMEKLRLMLSNGTDALRGITRGDVAGDTKES